jgi:hypothetical protein
VNPLLADPAAAPTSQQPPATDRPETGQSAGSHGAPPDGQQPQAANGEPPDGQTPAPAGPTCANCDAPLRDGQEWCLQCGAGQPGSLGERPNWRPLTSLALAAVLLTGAAAAAGAAALGSHTAAPPRTLTVAQAPVPVTPTTSPTTPTTPATPGKASTPTAPALKAPKGETGANNPLFPATGKPPKIPAPASTPKSSSPSTGGAKGSGESTGGSKTGATEKPSTTESKPSETKAAQPSAILLDTNAANTYNPYNYPEAGFGDPALAIDGEVTTAWTAQVQPSSAPNMAEGLVIDLKTPTKLGAMKLITTTPGMTVQLYGANGSKAPASITEPGWTPLSSSRVLKKKTTHLKLRASGQGFRFLVVWLVKAPAAAVGTPQAPGRVDLNEVELFPPAS